MRSRTGWMRPKGLQARQRGPFEEIRRDKQESWNEGWSQTPLRMGVRTLWKKAARRQRPGYSCGTPNGRSFLVSAWAMHIPTDGVLINCPKYQGQEEHAIWSTTNAIRTRHSRMSSWWEKKGSGMPRPVTIWPMRTGF
jgi:hypothetical protein